METGKASRLVRDGQSLRGEKDRKVRTFLERNRKENKERREEKQRYSFLFGLGFLFTTQIKDSIWIRIYTHEHGLYIISDGKKNSSLSGN